MEFLVGRIYKHINNGIAKYFVYVGDSDVSSQIIAGEIGCVDNSRDYIKLRNLNMVLFVDNLITINAKEVVSCLYFKGRPIDIEKSSFVVFINKVIERTVESYKNALVSNYSSNYDSKVDSIIDLALAEKIIRLLNWNDKKRELKFDVAVPQMSSCIKYGVYFAYLGTNVGSEINKLRPVVIWRKHESQTNALDNSYYVFPISSKIPKKNYLYNVHITINGADNVIHINDGRRISGLRILKPLIDRSTGNMFVLDDNAKSDVKNAIVKYFNT